ncbi:MAG: recombinase family protein [Anaerolineae bacterium]|nr:recombinase family protein [Anaerolineae bacterium]
MSIDAQRRALHDLAAARNLAILDEYADAVESGKDADRPAFQRLLADLKSPDRAFDWILVLDTSRIARRRLLAMVFERDCAARKVRIVYRNLPDTDPATEMIVRSVFQAFDEYHSLISKAKGLAGMAENVRQGWRAGGRAPRGYRLEHVATGAIRGGEPVRKSRLVIDEDTAPQVCAYLRLRAEGIPRGTVIARLRSPWPATSTHAMDWQALTYAGHTVWNMHAEREGGSTAEGEKRRPRADWLVQRDTHPALITDEQAEAILAQMEAGAAGRRNRATPLLLSGLVLAPDGRVWHSDGCGAYRLGKGRKIAVQRLEAAVLAKLQADLSSDEAVGHVMQALQADQGGRVDGRSVAALERRIAGLTQRIGRTVDLAAQIDDPAPVLRQVANLEASRAALVDELAAMHARLHQQQHAAVVTPADVRLALDALFADIRDRAAQHAPDVRMALTEVLERVELDPATLACRLHYAVRTGDKVASRKVSEQTPVRWTGQVFDLGPRRRRAA